MPYTPMPFIRGQWFDANGNPLASGRLFFYAAGTSTKQNTYTTSAGSVANANPVVLDAAGRADVFLQTGLSYKIVAAAAGSDDPPSSPLWTEDNITPTPGDTVYPDIPGTAGATVTAGDACYLSDGSGGLTAGRWYRCDSGTNYKSSTAQEIGFALSSGIVADAITFRQSGVVTGLSGLTAGTVYYAGVAGAITSTPPSLARRVGVAKSTTELVVSHFQQQVDASATSPGLMTTGTQTIAGDKTFSGNLSIGGSSGITVTGPITFRPGTAASGSATADGLTSSLSSAGVGNAAGGAATTLFSYTLPAGSVVSAKRFIVECAGTVTTSADGKDIALSVGGSATANIGLGAGGSAEAFWARFVVWYDTATQARYVGVCTRNNATRGTISGTLAVTWANANAILVTGASNTANNILLNNASLEV